MVEPAPGFLGALVVSCKRAPPFTFHPGIQQLTATQPLPPAAPPAARAPLPPPPQALRETIVPSARAYPLDALMADCQEYFR